MTNRRIVPFLFEGEITVRVVDHEAAPWFVAADICRALGLTNPAETVRDLDDDEKGISTTDTLGGHQQAVIVSESGLYALIFKSRKPNAAKFRKWITAEVLPSIRQTGSYVNTGYSVPQRATKPWAEWSLEERRIAVAEVMAARKAINQAAACWLWQHLGLPTPPPSLMPVWWQGELQIAAPHH